MKIFHSSDYHFEAEKIDKCRASVDFIIASAKRNPPDLHLITGDYFNRRQSLTIHSAILPALDSIIQLANISPVVLIYGNEAHDAAGSLDIFKTLDTVYPIHVSDRAESIYLVLSEGVKFVRTEELKTGMIVTALIHCMPYPTKAWFLSGQEVESIDDANQQIGQKLRDIFLGMGVLSEQAPPSLPVLFAGHLNVSGAKLSSGQTLIGQDIMVSHHDISLAKADYYALGHIHKAQRVGKDMYYAGSIYHNNYGETEAKTYNQVAILENGLLGTGVNSIFIPSRALSLHECRVEGGPLIDETLLLVNGRENEKAYDWKDAELRVRVHGTKEMLEQVSDSEIEAKYSEAFSYQIERIHTPEERVRSTEIVKAVTLAEKIVEWALSIDKDVPREVLELAEQTERTAAL
jgi:exonuclease SbcD